MASRGTAPTAQERDRRRRRREERLARRRAAVPVVSYPELPVSAVRDEIAAAIRDHQVVVVAGETGSGKTTQLPKILLELGRGVAGTIGHTQPRRIAARSVAERIAEELGVELGAAVGYQVRFHDQSGPETLVKVMTDGVLLAEIARDRDLRRYDTLVIDEAHERSLTIDFLLGYLVRLLPRRPDLKVVVTSATIDPHRFAGHFAAVAGHVPVLEVSGRTYPVEVRYRPYGAAAAAGDGADGPAGPDDEDDVDQVQAVVRAVAELDREPPGDVLVFLSGEREIRDTAEALRGEVGPDTEVLPLYGRLSAAEQHRVFEPHSGRRVVLATNVAETSLTVPGIRYVVDPGTARISRWSHRTKVQRLPIEPVSRASADQRKGRCGRLADGVCIRLYSEADYLARPAFTDPEILRTGLASVVLQMAALRLGDVAAFPFLDPPDRRQVRDALGLLTELGALEPVVAGQPLRLTSVGRQLAALPVDPRLARMVLAAPAEGCLRELLVLAAALSVQDPRESPADRRQQAAEAHGRFADEHSDFVALLRLWDYLGDRQRELSSSAFRRMCRREYLHYLRVREWQDLHAQLRAVTRSLGLEAGDGPADPAAVHRAVLAGLLSQIGLRDPEKREYVGARGARFAVVPSSALARKAPRWVMAGELVETTRLWARTVARIEPEWAEQVGAHLVQRSWSEPRWQRRRAAVVATERVTLYGLPLVVGRTVDYARVDPVASRELFLRHALVEGDWDAPHRFLAENRRLLEEAEQVEHRVRRRGLVVDDEVLLAFYAERVPDDVVSGRHFDAWWKKARRDRPDLLTLDPDTLVSESSGLDLADFPDAWVQGGSRLPLHYHFEPGDPADGVTVEVPMALLNQLDADDLAWQVPGLRAELATALIRGLPKALRRNFVPAPDVAAAALAAVPARAGRLTDALGGELERRTGVRVPAGAWDWSRVPEHLRLRVQVVEGGRVVAASRDVEELRERYAGRLRTALADAAAAGLERTGLRGFDLAEVPATVTREVDGHRLQGFPALVDEGGQVALRVLATPGEQRAAMWAGTRRLLLGELPAPVRAIQGRLSNAQKLTLAASPYPDVAALLDDCAVCALDWLVERAGGPAWDADGFARLRAEVAPAYAATVFAVVTDVEPVLATAHEVRTRAAGLPAALRPTVEDLRAWLDRLVGPGFVAATGRDRLPDLLRWLQAARRRLDVLADDPLRDQERLRRVQEVEAAYAAAVARLGPDALADVRWMLEELRVGVFAQPMRTAYPVSEVRVLRAIDAAAPG